MVILIVCGVIGVTVLAAAVYLLWTEKHCKRR